jgi:hypothetical protein
MGGVRSAIWRALLGIGAIAALVFGAWRIPNQPELLDPWVRKMLPEAQAWIVPATFIGLGAFMLGALIAHEILHRRLERRIAEELRRASGADWRETDAAEVLNYLRTRSAWAYKRYMEVNFWEMVFESARNELRRAGRRGDVRLSGEIPNSSDRVKPIQSGYWRRAEISPLEGVAFGVYASLNHIGTHVFGETNLHHLRVSTADYQLEWPRASISLRCRALLWVALKRLYYRLPEGAWPLRWYWWDKVDDNHAHEGPIRIRRKAPKP